MQQSKSKNWCFTINNPAEDWADLNLLKGYTYCVVGGEIGEDGTAHYQGFVQMETRKMFNQMKKLLPRAHLEAMRGNSIQARLRLLDEGWNVHRVSWSTRLHRSG